MTDDSTRTISLTAADGTVLAADLALPAAPRAAAVLCHPHPAYGGDRHNIVVDALFRALPAAGIAALRFDFRGAGGDVQDDVLGALDRLAGDVPGVPLWLVGYSFGADVALGVADPRLAGWVAIAPPLRFGTPPAPAGGDARPSLVLVAEHDAFSPPEHIWAATDDWPAVTVEVVPMADHFMVGAAAGVAATVTAWLSQDRA